MRVVCVSKYPNKEQIQELGDSFNLSKDLRLVIGQEYLVLGLRFEINRFYGNTTVVDYCDGEYIFGAPLCLFEVVSPQISRLWKMKMWENSTVTLWHPLFYEENFYDRFTEGDPNLQARFKKVYEVLDMEDRGLLDSCISDTQRI